MSTPRVRTRRPSASGALLAGVAGVTTWVTLLTWKDFSEAPAEYLGPLFSLALLLGLGGAGLRWLRVPVAVVPLVQLLVTGWVLVVLYGGHGPLPTPAGVHGLVDALHRASESANHYAAPVPFDAPSVAPLLVGCGALALIAVDLVACGLGRVPASGLALLMVYTVPVTIWGSAIPPWTFVLAAAGFLAMLYLREDERFSAWGRRLVSDPDAVNPLGFSSRSGPVRTSAMTVGAVATAAALVLPALVPTWGVGLFAGRFGGGANGGRHISIVNPIADLRRDLRQGVDVPLVQVKTTEKDPSYLRYTVLTTFTDDEWTPGDRDIPADQTANGDRLPSPVGVGAGVRRRSFTASYSTFPAFSSLWLPVPSFPTSVTAPGDWRYDASILDFVSGSDDPTEGLDYSATGVDLELTEADLDRSLSSDRQVVQRYTQLPRELPTIVTQLTDEITSGKDTAFEKALALQQFFRQTGGFTYTLDAPPGNGAQNLATFLSSGGPNGRRGYCEQFASAMAVMARVAGIPSRVALGFLTPDQVPGQSDTYVYSSHDLHAWPELYFQGAGWVRFEPTPASREGSQAPSYTKDVATQAPATDPTTRPSQSTRPSASVTRNAQPRSVTNAAAANRGGGFPWVRVLGGAGGLVLLVLAGLVPGVVRRARTRRRRHDATAEAAWAELRDSTLDLGLPWPDGRSPRATAAVVSAGLAAPGDVPRPVRGARADPEGDAALGRLVTALEVARYAPDPSPADPRRLVADVELVVASLWRGRPVRVRRRARWLPASVVGSTLGASHRAGATADPGDGSVAGSTNGPASREAASGQAEELESAGR